MEFFFHSAGASAQYFMDMNDRMKDKPYLYGEEAIRRAQAKRAALEAKAAENAARLERLAAAKKEIAAKKAAAKEALKAAIAKREAAEKQPAKPKVRLKKGETAPVEVVPTVEVDHTEEHEADMALHQLDREERSIGFDDETEEEREARLDREEWDRMDKAEARRLKREAKKTKQLATV